VKTTDELIQTYLDDLKAALQGADKATVQDALADAEEHLRTALESEKADQEDLAENEVIQGVIQTYGEAEEIAQAYLSWEQNLPPALAATPAARRIASANSTVNAYPGFFGVFADPRAWGGLVYMLISLVTGTLYFSWAVTGLSTSLGVMILIIGIPVMILFLLSVRGLSFLEGRLVEALLGERMPRRASFTDNSLPWKERLVQLLTGKSTWLGLIYMILMLPLGIIYFTVMVTLIALAAAFIAAPIAAIVFNVPFEAISYGEVIWHLPDYLTPLVAVFGVFLATVTMHLARWTGRVHGKFAKALLVSD
jgi:uncharacterized membrane protein